ncbi:MAG: Gx transporter family protein [Lachnospiraceae bacterium]|jgi:heptaprenyl diphosphate synthase|nr:Gx transporter family protein [Lachnospiraceae bacterium]
MSHRRLTALALCTTLALAIYAVESAIPPLVPIPGIKLGLANIVTLILLRHTSLKDAALVTGARTLLSAVLFGQLLSLLYSAAGAIFSLTLMYLVNRLLKNRYPYLTGAVGGLAHNAGQLLTALALTATPGVLTYLPFLVLAGILTGLFTGFCAFYGDKYLLRHLRWLKD